MQTQPTPWRAYDKIPSINNLEPDCSFVSSGRPYASAAFRVGLDALSLYLCPFVAIIVWSFAEVNTSRTHHAAKGWNHGTLTQKTQKLPFFLIRISSQKTYMHNICIICICIVYVVIYKYSSIQWFHIHNTGSRQICSRFEGRFAPFFVTMLSKTHRLLASNISCRNGQQRLHEMEFDKWLDCGPRRMGMHWQLLSESSASVTSTWWWTTVNSTIWNPSSQPLSEASEPHFWFCQVTSLFAGLAHSPCHNQQFVHRCQPQMERCKKHLCETAKPRSRRWNFLKGRNLESESTQSTESIIGPTPHSHLTNRIQRFDPWHTFIGVDLLLSGAPKSAFFIPRVTHAFKANLKRLLNSWIKDLAVDACHLPHWFKKRRKDSQLLFRPFNYNGSSGMDSWMFLDCSSSI